MTIVVESIYMCLGIFYSQVTLRCIEMQTE